MGRGGGEWGTHVSYLVFGANDSVLTELAELHIVVLQERVPGTSRKHKATVRISKVTCENVNVIFPFRDSLHDEDRVHAPEG